MRKVLLATAVIVITGFTLSSAALAENSKAQAAVDTFQNMSPEQRQELMHTGVDQVQDLSPEQIKQFKDMFNSMSPEQKAQMEAQIEQEMAKDPKLKAEAEKKLQNLTPEQRKQLESK